MTKIPGALFDMHVSADLSGKPRAKVTVHCSVWFDLVCYSLVGSHRCWISGTSTALIRSGYPQS